MGVGGGNMQAAAYVHVRRLSRAPSLPSSARPPASQPAKKTAREPARHLGAEQVDVPRSCRRQLAVLAQHAQHGLYPIEERHQGHARQQGEHQSLLEGGAHCGVGAGAVGLAAKGVYAARHAVEQSDAWGWVAGQ